MFFFPVFFWIFGYIRWVAYRFGFEFVLFALSSRSVGTCLRAHVVAGSVSGYAYYYCFTGVAFGAFCCFGIFFYWPRDGFRFLVRAVWARVKKRDPLLVVLWFFWYFG